MLLSTGGERGGCYWVLVMREAGITEYLLVMRGAGVTEYWS